MAEVGPGWVCIPITAHVASDQNNRGVPDPWGRALETAPPRPVSSVPRRGTTSGLGEAGHSHAWRLGRLVCAVCIPQYCNQEVESFARVSVVVRGATSTLNLSPCVSRHPWSRAGPRRRLRWAAASSVCADRCPPWGPTLGKGLARSRGHSGTSWAPCYRTYRCSHRDHKQPPRNPADCGKLGQEIQ